MEGGGDLNRRVSNQDISWFLDLERNGQLDLDPPYQRRSVWSPRDRRFFLDTIFRGYPSPAIFLYKKSHEDGRHTYEVVDGKQRLETILSFAANRIAIDKSYGDSSLAGKKWREIGETVRQRFWDYVIPVEFIKIIEGTVVNQMFERLNRNSRKLERQELRHARNEGWFITFVEKEAEEDEFWESFKLTSTAKARRMKDVQFVSELMLVLLCGAVQGFDQDALDQVSADYDVPEETFGDFDSTEIIRRFHSAKDYIRKMEEINGCVTSHATTANNFYSLWSWVVLGNAGVEVAVAARRYLDLMTTVEKLRDQSRAKDSSGEHQEPLGQLPYLEEANKYTRNAMGASTEFAQRLARHEVLQEVLSAQERL